MITDSAFFAVGRVLTPKYLGLAQRAPWLDFSTDQAGAAAGLAEVCALLPAETGAAAGKSLGRCGRGG